MRLILFILVIFVGIMPAQQYDLQQVLRLAEENNLELQLARADLKTASARKLSALSTALPQIEFNAGYNRNLKENVIYFPEFDPQTFRPIEGSRVAIPISFDNEFNLSGSVRQTLLSFKVGYAIQASRHFDKFTNFQFESIRQSVFTRVKGTYYLALLQRKVADHAKESEESAHSNYQVFKDKFDNGLVSEYELLQAETRWQNSIPITIQAEQQHQSALNALKGMAGIPIESGVELTGSLQNFPELPADVGPTSVLEQRPDYNALRWEKQLQEVNVKSQKAEFLPSLEGSFTYTFAAASNEFQLDNDNDNYILGLSLSVPIFSGGNRVANVRLASAEVDRVSTRIQTAEDNIAIELRDLQLRMREAHQRITATRKASETARRAYEIAETRVSHGLSTQVELKDSRVELDLAMINHYRAIYDYLLAYFDWELATGSVQYGQ